MSDQQNHTTDIEQLRLELGRRMQVRPVHDWSASLLTALIACFDLAGIAGSDLKSDPPKLTIVR